MVQHEVLFQILSKYGLPKELTNVIKKMYKTCKVKLTIGEITKDINYETGIQQGNNVAPVLFLFVMQAIMETLDLSNIMKAKYHYFPCSNNPLTHDRRYLINMSQFHLHYRIEPKGVKPWEFDLWDIIIIHRVLIRIAGSRLCICNEKSS